MLFVQSQCTAEFAESLVENLHNLELLLEAVQAVTFKDEMAVVLQQQADVVAPSATAATSTSQQASLRVQWSSREELAADDVWDYLCGFGQIVDLD